MTLLPESWAKEHLMFPLSETHQGGAGQVGPWGRKHRCHRNVSVRPLSEFTLPVHECLPRASTFAPALTFR